MFTKKKQSISLKVSLESDMKMMRKNRKELGIGASHFTFQKNKNKIEYYFDFTNFNAWGEIISIRTVHTSNYIVRGIFKRCQYHSNTQFH